MIEGDRGECDNTEINIITAVIGMRSKQLSIRISDQNQQIQLTSMFNHL